VRARLGLSQQAVSSVEQTWRAAADRDGASSFSARDRRREVSRWFVTRRFSTRTEASRPVVDDLQVGIAREIGPGMRKTNNKKHALNLNTETVRSMQEQELATAAGGTYPSGYPQQRSCYFTCPPPSGRTM
jgi:hypothetical protein